MRTTQNFRERVRYEKSSYWFMLTAYLGSCDFVNPSTVRACSAQIDQEYDRLNYE